MNTIQCFCEGSVQELSCSEKYSALRELVRKAPIFREIPDLTKLEAAVISRENEQSTGFGHGVALAHAKLQEAKKPLIAMGISRQGIRYNAIDRKLVYLLFIIVNNPNKPNEYLSVLSTLVRLVRNDDFRLHLQNLPAPEAEKSLIDEYTARFRDVCCFAAQETQVS
jgi:mannitol/fructose-specific phosphotransferase system IIA component (Ntr-type)